MRRASSVSRGACATRRRRSPGSTASRCANARPSDAGSGFAILDSGGGRAATAIGPDSAICGDCLAEMLDPRDRRYRYAFINCTNCGPRYTITRRAAVRPRLHQHGRLRAVRALPRGIPLAARSPLPRRTQRVPGLRPAACVPRRARASASPDVDAVAEAMARLRRGDIVAIKGLGGFHLACDARNAGARRPPARTQGARGKAVRGDGRQRRVGARLDGDRAGRSGAARGARARHRPAAQARRRRRRCWPASRRASRGSASCCRTRRCTTCCFTRRRDVRPAPAGSRTAQDLVLVMTSANPGRRAAGDRQRRGGRAPRRHRRRVRRARPRHRRRLRRQRAARASGCGSQRNSSSSAARAVTRRARSGSRPRDRRWSRWAATSRTRCA